MSSTSYAAVDVDGRTIQQVESRSRPFGDQTRVIGEMSMDDPDFDLAAIMQHALNHYDTVQYSVVAAEGQDVATAGAAAGRDIACGIIAKQDYESFMLMKRTRVVFDTVHHSIVLEVLSKSGASVKETVASSFPSIDGGYDAWKDRVVVQQETSARWWTAHKDVVVTKVEHLPTVSDKAMRASEQHAWRSSQPNFVNDLPENLKGYPRPMCDSPPNHGEQCVLALQCDLERAVAIAPKQLFRIRIVGLTGTNGQTYMSDVISGKQLRDAMERKFKERKQYLKHLQDQVDRAPPTFDVDVAHCGNLCCGSSIGYTQGTIHEDKAFLSAFHTAWSSTNVKTRQLMITGIMTSHVFSRPARSNVEAETDVCATCLEDIAGDGWTCNTCNNLQHRSCIEDWRRHCEGAGCAATCPICRATLQL